VSIEVDTDTASGGLLIANTPNPPVGYDPVLQPVTDTPVEPIVVTRKAVTLRRPAPECSTYIVVLYAHLAADIYTASASIVGDPTNTVSSCTRTVSLGDAEFDAVNAAGYGLFAIGELTLPPTDVDPQNTDAEVTITVDSGSPINGVWLVWAGGENVQVFLTDSGATQAWFLDAPAPGAVSGRLSASATDRSAAFDVSANRDGEPVVNFTPGADHLLVVALPSTATPTTNPTPTATVTYFSRWLTERAS
jgi:hypothetical protein